MIKNALEMPRVLKLTRSKIIPMIKARTNNQFALDKTINTKRIKKTKGIVVKLASRIKATDKRKIARNFINY
jgi:hypothetical protein